jgi:hypothetical protein
MISTQHTVYCVNEYLSQHIFASGRNKSKEPYLSKKVYTTIKCLEFNVYKLLKQAQKARGKKLKLGFPE